MTFLDFTDQNDFFDDVRKLKNDGITYLHLSRELTGQSSQFRTCLEPEKIGGLFRTLSKIYNGAFLKKKVTARGC